MQRMFITADPVPVVTPLVFSLPRSSGILITVLHCPVRQLCWIIFPVAVTIIQVVLSSGQLLNLVLMLHIHNTGYTILSVIWAQVSSLILPAQRMRRTLT